ncbi:MAG: hypothetical protein Ct9H300mP16_11650 [Pseudomonadota bacterium]|nr:MAG: hypothetical protein Ct9H300mP16_11650 [Pseudomonadota bacterium]
MATVLIMPSVVFMIFFPEIIISIYTSDSEVVPVATALFMIAALFQIFEGFIHDRGWCTQRDERH